MTPADRYTLTLRDAEQPDLIRRRADGNPAGGLPPRWDEIITGKKLAKLLAGCPPAQKMTCIGPAEVVSG
jgi:hypothetical protein